MTTPHFGLDEIRRGENLGDNGYKFSTTDRRLIDLLLFILFNHHHNGVQNADVAPNAALDLEVDQSAGSLPAGTRVFYKYTLVDDNGVESLPSPEAFIETPAAVTSPSAPQWEFLNSGGSLLPGQYTYVLSAYKDSTTLETPAVSFTSVSVAAGANTNQVILTLPDLPAGAGGFNVYRRKPGGISFAYLSSIDMTVATPPTEFVDDGSYTEDANNVAPTANTTNAQNSILVSLPGATPVVPDGFTWRLYRSLISGVYTASLLHHVVEQTSEGSGVVVPEYTDLGTATIGEAPPTSAFPIGNPDLVQLTNAAEVQGVLPPANVIFRDRIEWRLAGTFDIQEGTEVWTCPYELALIQFVKCSLGKHSLAGGIDDIIDINKWDSSLATPVWASIFTDQTLRPRIVVGHDDSQDAVPSVRTLVKGDKLSYDIDQVGNLATPTDEDLHIQVLIYYVDTTATSVDVTP